MDESDYADSRREFILAQSHIQAKARAQTHTQLQAEAKAQAEMKARKDTEAMAMAGETKYKDALLESEPAKSDGSPDLDALLESEPAKSDGSPDLDALLASEPTTSGGSPDLDALLESEPEKSDGSPDLDALLESEPTTSGGSPDLDALLESEPAKSDGSPDLDALLESEPTVSGGSPDLDVLVVVESNCENHDSHRGEDENDGEHGIAHIVGAVCQEKTEAKTIADQAATIAVQRGFGGKFDDVVPDSEDDEIIGAVLDMFDTKKCEENDNLEEDDVESKREMVAEEWVNLCSQQKEAVLAAQQELQDLQEQVDTAISTERSVEVDRKVDEIEKGLRGFRVKLRMAQTTLKKKPDDETAQKKLENVQSQINEREASIAKLRAEQCTGTASGPQGKLCYAYGAGIWKAFVGLPCEILVGFANSSGRCPGQIGDIEAQVRLEGGEWTGCQCTMLSNEEVSVKFVAGYEAPHEVQIKVKGENICGSPFSVPGVRALGKIVQILDDNNNLVESAVVTVWQLHALLRPEKASDTRRNVVAIPIKGKYVSASEKTKLHFPGDITEGACIVEVRANGYLTTLDWLYLEPELVDTLPPTPIILESPWTENDDEHLDPIADMDDDVSY